MINTTANGAQYKSSLAEIPETLDLIAISQQQAIILLPEGCLPMIRGASGLVGTTSVSLSNGHFVYTTTAAINGAECTCTILKWHSGGRFSDPKRRPESRPLIRRNKYCGSQRFYVTSCDMHLSHLVFCFCYVFPQNPSKIRGSQRLWHNK